VCLATVTLSGFNVFTQYLGKLQDSLDSIAAAAVREVAESIRDDAKEWVRVDTGSLRKSIRVQNRRLSGGFHTIGVSAGGYVTNPKTGRKVDYALYVEADYPFLRPAVMAHAMDLVAAMKWRMSNV